MIVIKIPIDSREASSSGNQHIHFKSQAPLTSDPVLQTGLKHSSFSTFLSSVIVLSPAVNGSSKRVGSLFTVACVAAEIGSDWDLKSGVKEDMFVVPIQQRTEISRI